MITFQKIILIIMSFFYINVGVKHFINTEWFLFIIPPYLTFIDLELVYISGILEILNVSASVTFDSLFTTLNTKQEVIVTFLAILELMRMQLIRSQQARQFDVIRFYATVSREVQEEVLKEFYDTDENETSSAGS